MAYVMDDDQDDGLGRIGGRGRIMRARRRRTIPVSRTLALRARITTPSGTTYRRRPRITTRRQEEENGENGGGTVFRRRQTTAARRRAATGRGRMSLMRRMAQRAAERKREAEAARLMRERSRIPRNGGYTPPPPGPPPQVTNGARWGRPRTPGGPPDRRIGWRMIDGKWEYRPIMYTSLPVRPPIRPPPPGFMPRPPRPRIQDQVVNGAAPRLGPERPPFVFAPKPVEAPAAVAGDSKGGAPDWLIPAVAAAAAAAFLF